MYASEGATCTALYAIVYFSTLFDRKLTQIAKGWETGRVAHNFINKLTQSALTVQFTYIRFDAQLVRNPCKRAIVSFFVHSFVFFSGSHLLFTIIKIPIFTAKTVYKQ